MSNGNHADIKFRNPLIIEIFSRYADNTTMAGIVDTAGSISLSLNAPSDIIPPKTADDLLGVFYSLLAENPDSPMGSIYKENETAILRESIYRFRQITDGFGGAELELTVSAPDKNDPNAVTTSTTEFRMTRNTTTETT